MNVFDKKGKLIASTDQPVKMPTVAAFSGSGSLPQGVYSQENWARQVIAECTQQPPVIDNADSSEGGAKGKKGGFIWSLE